jgi:poly-gamma-glutamate capsule biosynthesis protein CapA/YwtB (metallophosphatase superfamily)
MVATNIARTDVAVDQAAAVEVGQGISQVVRGSGEAPEAILATDSGQVRQQIGLHQLVGYQKEPASQWTFGDASGVPDPDDATVVEFT